MPKLKKSSDARVPQLRVLALLIVLGLLLYLVLPQIGQFHTSAALLRHAVPGAVLFAVLASLVAHMMAAVKYQALAVKRLPFGKTLWVQFAGLLTNRLLPAGIGGIGINYLYLRKQRHNRVQAAAVISMNNLLGLIGHALLITLLLLVSPDVSPPQLKGGVSNIFAVILLCAVAVLVAMVIFRHKLKRDAQELLKVLRSYRKHPGGPLLAVLCSVAITLSYALCLWYCAQALHSPVAFLPALLVLTLGVSASAVSPTPGGLVGVEAALLAGLMLYEIVPADALAIALLFRFITYWLALLFGAVAFVIVERKKII